MRTQKEIEDILERAYSIKDSYEEGEGTYIQADADYADGIISALEWLNENGDNPFADYK